jgi:hypothetical protein
LGKVLFYTSRPRAKTLTQEIVDRDGHEQLYREDIYQRIKSERKEP